MIFKFSFDAAFSSTAITAAAAITSAAIDVNELPTGFVPTTKADDGDSFSTTIGHFVPHKIVASNGAEITDIRNEDIFHSLILENALGTKSRDSELSIKNSQAAEMDGGSTAAETDDLSEDIGILKSGWDAANGNTETVYAHGNRELRPKKKKKKKNKFDCETCEDRPLIDADADIESLVNICFYDGVDDDRCPGEIKCWDTSLVKSLYNAFYYVKDFNDPLDCWDVSSVEEMNYTFEYASSFNQPLKQWDTSSVTTMGGMFYLAESFNQPIGKWKTSKVTSMRNMFFKAKEFNQPIDKWDVSSVTKMNTMLKRAYSFNQCISTWAIKTDDVLTKNMFYYSGCPIREVDPEPNIGPWCQGEDQQCYSCRDDPDFRLYDTNSKDCDFVAEAKENRCEKPGAFEGCPATCDPSCEEVQTLAPTKRPTKAPTKAPAPTDKPVKCENDETFRLNGNPNKDCDWVKRSETENRCTKEGVYDACPVVCNPACIVNDCFNDPDFRLKGNPNKDCEWAGKKETENRCTKNGVAAFCPATCDPKCATPSPTTAPTRSPAPTVSSCVDIEGFIFNGFEKKTCEWVGENTNFRCGIIDDDTGLNAKQACPSKCNKRCTCTNEFDAFRYKDEMRTCAQVKNKSNCDRDAGLPRGEKTVSDFCPKLCDDCYVDPDSE